MYTLVRQSALSSWKFAVLKIALEFLMFFIVAFNPSSIQWKIDTSNPVWQVIRWTLWRSPIIRLYGYRTYITVMYVMAGAVLVAVLGLVWLTVAMRKAEQSKWLRTAALALYIVYDVIFFMCYASFFDYFVFVTNCDFSAKVKKHMYFTNIMCFEMPHLLHLCVGAFTAVVFLLVTALMVISSCDLNPISRGFLASPTVYPRLKILVAKALYVLAIATLDSEAKLQAVLAVIAVAFICWWNFTSLPFYRRPINILWCSQWVGILYTCVMMAMLTFTKNHSPEFAKRNTMNVLYGIFPVIGGSALICTLHAWWAMRPAKKFIDLEPGAKLSAVHKFADVYEVERLARVMRVFDIDGVVDEGAAAWGETVIKAGMQVFRNHPYLLILYANFLLEVRRDGPAARTQLQLAAKHSPSLVERYQVFCTDEASKRLKDSQDGGMDLQAYIEFRRNYRAVIRVHKEALMMQTEMWKLFLRPTLRVSHVDSAMDDVEAATGRAHQVYKKVLERYPNNGKLLRCYGKFLEDVRHDSVAAARAYAEANRTGGADGLLTLDMSAMQQSGAEKPEFLTSMSMVEDAVVVANAEGTIMMVSQAVQGLFGWSKAELEGANVSLLMPQPFSQRHTGYMQRYAATGEVHLLDSVREVVALHKERYVFPLALCVTKLSGTGVDSIFLAVMRALPANAHNLRAWLAPNGVFLCGDQHFASMIGVNEGDLVGKSLMALVPEHMHAVAEGLLAQCREADAAALQSRSIVVQLQLLHRFTDPIPVEATISMAGTDGQRILVLHCRRTDGEDGNLLVVDPNMRIRFCSCGVASMLGHPMRKVAAMRLDALLPQPFNELHTKWLREAPHAPTSTSCRSGVVVHLINSAGARVPVRLRVITKTTGTTGAMDLEAVHHVVEVEKVAMTEELEEKRLVLTADFTGRVQLVSRPDSELFGFPAGVLLGASLCDFVDIFSEWRDRNGDSEIQLLLLSLLDREQEMPGASWRVHVHPPCAGAGSTKDGQLPPAPGATCAARSGGARSISSRSACLQVELHSESRTESESQGGLEGGEDGGPAPQHQARIRVVLWRRDLLTGVVELDDNLTVRKASPMTGLIVGLPATALAKKHLKSFLDIPTGPDVTWEKLAEAHTHKAKKKKSVLKPSVNRGTVSPVMAFIGPHPDMGTMRILIQGVQTLGPGGKPRVTLTMHPDTSFTGARANLMRVLKLEGVDGGASGGGGGGGGGGTSDTPIPSGLAMNVDIAHVSGSGALAEARPKSSALPAARALDESPGGSGGMERRPAGPGGAEHCEDGERECGDGDAGDAGSDGKDSAERSRSSGRASDDDDGDDVPPGTAAADAADAARAVTHCASLHRQATSRSDFVAQWVRTITHAGSHGLSSGPPPPQQPALRSGTVTATASRLMISLAPVPETEPVAPGAPEGGAPEEGAAAAPGGAAGRLIGSAGDVPGLGALLGRESGRTPRLDPRSTIGSLARARSELLEDLVDGGPGGGPAGSGDGQDGGGGGGGKPEGSEGGDSSADGSQAASAFTSITDSSSVADIAVDSRRGRLLKGLHKMLLGPSLTGPLDRLHNRTYLVLLAMLVTHVVCYVVVTQLVSQQHTNVYMVQSQALAMDRSQLIMARVMMGTFCARANNTDKSSSCSNTMNYTVGKLMENIALMEQHHQDVYLGVRGIQKLSPDIYDVWTQHHLDYQIFVDSNPPKVITDRIGVWQLGNRLLAAAREALYWMPRLGDVYKFHRTWPFIIYNGLGPLFKGYAASLDLLMEAAWRGVAELRTDLIIVLAVEALFIQVLCSAYQWGLVQTVERARLLGMVAMLGLPGPVLRQLASREIRVLDDDDDEDDDNDSMAGDEEQAARGQGRGDKGDSGSAGGHDTVKPEGAIASGGAGADDPGKQQSAGGAAKGAMPLARPMGSIRRVSSPEAGRRTPTFALAGPAGGAGGRAEAGKAAEEGPEAGAGAKALRSRTAKVLNTEEPNGSPTFSPPSHKNGSFNLARSGDRLPSGGGDGGGGGGGVRRAARGLRINGRTLVLSQSNLAWFMAPLLTWNIAVILVYGISLAKLGDMQGPLASLNMASHVIFRFTRVRVGAFGLVSQDDNESRAVWRDLLKQELRMFEDEYEVLMYGGTSLSQAEGSFHENVPASTFASSDFAQAFFREKICFRWDQTLCLPPGHKYYEVTHNGLDVMVRRIIQEMKLLTLDDDRDAVYNKSRYDFMHMVGGRDCYEGLQTAAQLFVDYSIRQYNQVTKIHTILLAITVAIFVLYIVLLLWPHRTRVLGDATRQSAMLSHVPPEVDVRTHVRTVLRRVGATGKKRRAPTEGFAALSTT